MLKITNLSKQFGTTVALDDISLSIEKGKITGFLGPNGAGKTTALRIMTGFLEPDSGSVSYNNNKIASNLQSVKYQIGYLPENNPLYSNMRVDEFLMFNAKIKNFSKKRKLKEIVDKCGLTEVLTKEIETLSKGFRQRVGLAKALIGDPKFLILDEPTTGLDPNQKEEIFKLIKQYAKDKTIIFSSHILSEVKELADDVIIINEGEIVAQGNADKLAKEYFKGEQIIVTTNAPYHTLKKSLDKYKEITGVKKNSTQRGFFEYTVTCSNPDKTSVKIFETIVKNNWKLKQLYGKTQGLEELFRKLTK